MADFSQKVKVSTHSIAFFNEDRAMLKIVYLEDAITISINFPSIVDGKVSYPQEMRHSVLLNQNNVSALYTMIMEHVFPAFEAGNNKDVGVFTNRNKTQMFEAVTKGGSFFVMIHDEIESRIPKNTYIFKFDKTQVITDYDIEAVSFHTEDLDAQFAVFCKVLESFTLLSNGITAHEYQYRQSYFIDQIKQLASAMNTKFNLGTGYQRSGSSNSYGNSGFDSVTSGSPVEVKEGTMNDIMGGIMGDELPFR